MGAALAAAAGNPPPVLGSALFHIYSSSCCVAITLSIQAQPCGFAARQHERKNRMRPAPLEVGSASTRSAASGHFLCGLSRTFSASYIVFCIPRSLAHEKRDMRKSTNRGGPETTNDALLSGLLLRAKPNPHFFFFTLLRSEQPKLVCLLSNTS